jgi:hypothetical protein
MVIAEHQTGLQIARDYGFHPRRSLLRGRDGRSPSAQWIGTFEEAADSRAAKSAEACPMIVQQAGRSDKGGNSFFGGGDLQMNSHTPI